MEVVLDMTASHLEPMTPIELHNVESVTPIEVPNVEPVTPIKDHL